MLKIWVFCLSLDWMRYLTSAIALRHEPSPQSCAFAMAPDRQARAANLADLTWTRTKMDPMGQAYLGRVPKEESTLFLAVSAEDMLKR